MSEQATERVRRALSSIHIPVRERARQARVVIERSGVHAPDKIKKQGYADLIDEFSQHRFVEQRHGAENSLLAQIFALLGTSFFVRFEY